MSVFTFFYILFVYFDRQSRYNFKIKRNYYNSVHQLMKKTQRFLPVLFTFVITELNIISTRLSLKFSSTFTFIYN